MLQRIQSIFLLVSSLAYWGLFAVPFASGAENSNSIFSDKVLNRNDHIGLLITCVLGGILSFGAIFLFKNRKLQMNISYLSFIPALALAGLAYWLFSTSDGGDLGIGMGLPAVSAICSLVAASFIKKDDKLVKSMDRLR